MTFPTAIPHPYLGPMFPDSEQQKFYFAGHFPDKGQAAAGPLLAFGPPTVATFVLNLDAGFQVKFTWITDIEKAYGGAEQRRQVLDAPKQTYTGTAVLVGNDVRALRGRLARFAAAGKAFGLGLRHEEMTLVADAAGESVFVSDEALAACDWSNPGQRVVLLAPDGTTSTEAVLQSASGGTVVLDRAAGAAGVAGGSIMPIVPIYLDPQQGFSRFTGEDGVEQWSITAYAALYDFAPTLASLPASALPGPPPSLAGVTFYARTFGMAGNLTTLQLTVQALGIGVTTEMVEGAPPAQSTSVEATTGVGVATVGDLRTILERSAWVTMEGGVDANVLGASDSFPATAFTGGTDGGPVGVGAAVTTYNGVPVWDRGLGVSGSVADSIQALTTIVQFEGLPLAISAADVADWGRHVRLARTSIADWQWFKAFVAAVGGRRVAFYLPTWRPDLEWASTGAGGTTITIDGPDEATGDFLAWWPNLRSKLQVVHTDLTVEYVGVSAYVDNGNGTLTLTLDAPIAATAVRMLSWLELCRFEQDDFTVTFAGPGFTFEADARVVQR